MHFEWDDEKNEINIRKHGIDFTDAVDIFNYPYLTLKDESRIYDEERWIAIGCFNFLIGVVIYTEPKENLIRVISARKATSNEVRRYEQIFKN